MFTNCSNVELIDIRYFTPPSDIDVSGIFNGINSGNWILYIKAAFLKTILDKKELTDYTIDANDDTVLELTCEGTNITQIVSTEEPETTTEYDISEEGILTFTSNATQNTLLTPISALALTKEETVYSKLDSDGKVKSIIVNEHLINSNKEDKLEDITDLEEIVNINSDNKFNVNKFYIDIST